MIERLPESSKAIRQYPSNSVQDLIRLSDKINELIDAVNRLEKESVKLGETSRDVCSVCGVDHSV